MATWNGDSIPDEILTIYDQHQHHVLCLHGPWDLDKPGQHAPFFDKCEEDIQILFGKKGDTSG